MKLDRALALRLARRQLAELVYDAVNLENIPFSLSEIIALLDGVTVSGHKLSDQIIALNQAEAWNYLFSAIEQDTFALSIDFVCALHAVAAKEEALKWGQFRDGSVTIAGTTYSPPQASKLNDCFHEMVSDAAKIENIYDRAIFVFLRMARTQFFYDVNKRMGRFMMNGILLEAGYPIINVPAKRQLEFNTLMLEFYDTDQMSAMNQFLRSCLDERVVKMFS